MKRIASSLAPGLLAVATGLLALAAAPAAASLPADAETSYGYLRTVEGPGRLVQQASGASIDVEANYPVLAGDLLEVDPGGRLELSLPDFNVVRLAGGTELMLGRLALSAETEDTETALRLLRGEIQFLVHDLLPVTERPRVDTANATVYLMGSGVYRIATDGYGWTEVVVRRGFAEIATEAGSSVVRSGEQAWVEGGRWPRVAVDRAGTYDDLERWGAELDGELAGYSATPVEDHLSYSAAPLSRHGSWVVHDGYRAWRPAVASTWRPYEAGYWADTPTGMVWVSHEPWGWLTYHYGTWVPSLHYGWVWRPGFRFAPAWVYWYWGPSYVAWVPVGYYSSFYTGHYGRYGHGFRFGIYGWAGGSWGLFADWTFCSTRDYRRRDLRHHVHRGHRLARDTRSFALDRGLISTDSRHETRLRASRRGTAALAGEESLPDVTAFVARQRELPREVSDRVFTERRAVARDDAWQSPRQARSESPRARVVPRPEARETVDAWRRESGRLPAPTTRAERPAVPRGGAVRSGDGAGERSRWLENRSGGPVPRAATPRRQGSFGPTTRPEAARPSAEDRPPVVRRVWEGIRDRQRSWPAVPRTSPGTPSARPPVTDRPAVPSRTPSTGPSAPPSRTPTTVRPGSTPPQGTPSARPSPAPPRGTPSTRPSPPPSRSSSVESRPSPSRSQPSARSGGGSERRSSARSSSSGGGRRSSEGSSGGRSARRRPPS